MVFDDGKKTFFKFGRGTVPAIFAVQSDFSETLRNFRKEGEYIVVDGVATQYTLRDGNQWTCIFNLRKRTLQHLILTSWLRNRILMPANAGGAATNEAQP